MWWRRPKELSEPPLKPIAVKVRTKYHMNLTYLTTHSQIVGGELNLFYNGHLVASFASGIWEMIEVQRPEYVVREVAVG